MAEITAASVKKLRDRTSLPMMECKQALTETDGDEEAAVELLRKKGNSKMMARADERETAFGRLACFASVEKGVGAMVELVCESDPVAKSDEFIAMANDMAKQLALGPGAGTAEGLLSQPSPSKAGQTLGEVLSDATNRIREVMKITRLVRIDSPCGAYAHFTGTDGVLVEVEGKDQAVANDVAMQVAAMKPLVAHRDMLPADVVEKERELQREMARSEGKPENIIEKMIEGRMRLFYEQRVLVDQVFVKDDKKKVEQILKEAKTKVLKFVHWKLGKSAE